MIHYLLDTSWLLYKGYFTTKNVWPNYPELHFLCKKIESLLANKSAIVYVCLDGKNTKGKRLLGENYKAGRHQDNNYNVYKGLASFISLLNNDRIKIYYNQNYESDEIIFTLSKTLPDYKKIISGDKDIFQALTTDVVIDNGKDFVITEESYKLEYADKFFEIAPNKLPLFRAIVGDISDALKPPVARFPKKIAAKFVNSFNYIGSIPTIEELKTLTKDYSKTELKWINKLIDAYEAFNINFQIMKLNVIDDNLHESYMYDKVVLDDFLTSKILKLNTL